MTVSGWVKVDNWVDVGVGVRVQLRSAAGTLEGVVKKASRFSSGNSYLVLREADSGNLWSNDWDLYVPAPTFVLPTVPGTVIRYDDGERWPYTLNDLGDNWFSARWSADSSHTGIRTVDMRQAPFTVLESRSTTAKEVLDSVRREFIPGFQSIEGILAEVAAEFGVSS